jgi:hypothetical protein
VVPIIDGQVSGLFEARILRGGADWQIVRADGAGVRSGPPQILDALLRGEAVDPSEYYFRVAVRLETSAPWLDALERSIFVASAVREADAVFYTAYRVT